jgi:hypothetical protein
MLDDVAGKVAARRIIRSKTPPETAARHPHLLLPPHCALVQLTTDKSRTGAHRFYERLRFVASHEGMKLSFRESGRPSPGDGAADGPAA